MRQALDQAGPDRIEDERHHDRDSGCGPLGSFSANRAVFDNHIDPAPDQVGGQFWYPTVIALGVSPVDHDVAPLGVPCLPQPLPKLLRRFAIRRLSDEQEADVAAVRPVARGSRVAERRRRH